MYFILNLTCPVNILSYKAKSRIYRSRDGMAWFAPVLSGPMCYVMYVELFCEISERKVGLDDEPVRSVEGTVSVLCLG